jgi:hypothetical protein
MIEVGAAGVILYLNIIGTGVRFIETENRKNF